MRKYITPLASCYSQYKRGIFDPSRVYTPREVCSKQQNVLHSHMCTSCASSFRRTEYFRYTSNWWDPHGGSKPWSHLASTKVNNGIYITQNSLPTCAWTVTFQKSKDLKVNVSLSTKRSRVWPVNHLYYDKPYTDKTLQWQPLFS